MGQRTGLLNGYYGVTGIRWKQGAEEKVRSLCDLGGRRLILVILHGARRHGKEVNEKLGGWARRWAERAL